MAKIKTDNKDIKRIITELVLLVTSAGGILHKNLVINCTKGNMQLGWSKVCQSNEVMLSVPENCIPHLKHFHVKFDGSTLWANPQTLDQKLERTGKKNIDFSATPQQITAMMLMVELYNVTNKINLFADCAPSYVFAEHKTILAELSKSTSVDIGLGAIERQDNQCKLDAFLKSRCYFDEDTGTQRLLPLIDFADHHCQAQGFYCLRDNVGDFQALQLIFSEVPGKKMCFSNYKSKDRLASYISYGFLDNSVSYVQSIPLEIELPQFGKFKVNSAFPDDNRLSIERVRAVLPDFSFSKKDHEFYTPTVLWPDDSTMEVHFSLIPKGKAIAALRETIQLQLKLLEIKFKCSAGTYDSLENCLYIEKEIIERNKVYYSELQRILDDESSAMQPSIAINTLQDVIDYQLAHLKNYHKKMLENV